MGFLGSGKTTLIAALLKQPDMDNVGVIVNEFGAVGIDDAIFEQAIDPDDVLLLANGCLGCSGGSDLCATVWTLTPRATPPRHIVIEAPIELVANGTVGESKLFDDSLYVARNGAADPNRSLNAAAYRARPVRDRAIFADYDVHDPTPLGTWVLEETRPVNWALLPQRLSVIIAHHGDRLLRIKGLIYCVRDERPIAIHGVQLVFHTPLRLERWVSPPKTTLVIIGDVGARPTIEGIADALRSSVVEDGSATLDEVA
jgi:G3E family GTPase